VFTPDDEATGGQGTGNQPGGSNNGSDNISPENKYYEYCWVRTDYTNSDNGRLMMCRNCRLENGRTVASYRCEPTYRPDISCNEYNRLLNPYKSCASGQEAISGIINMPIDFAEMPQVCLPAPRGGIARDDEGNITREWVMGDGQFVPSL